MPQNVLEDKQIKSLLVNQCIGVGRTKEVGFNSWQDFITGDSSRLVTITNPTVLVGWLSTIKTYFFCSTTFNKGHDKNVTHLAFSLLSWRSLKALADLFNVITFKAEHVIFTRNFIMRCVPLFKMLLALVVYWGASGNIRENAKKKT